MLMVDSLAALRAIREQWRDDRSTVALVPTMGNLHAGHLSLVDQARELADRVVVSIFVNPSQFAPNEDYQSYPRTPDRDAALLDAAQCDLLFAPHSDALYPAGIEEMTRIQVPRLNSDLCGYYRPGHFDGVATIVAKLAHIIEPHHLLFGEKDYQQLLVIRKMVADLNWPVAVTSGATVREPDGLAMSSRNQYLDTEQRKRASYLYQTLQWSRQAVASGSLPVAVEVQAMERLKVVLEPDYVAIRRAADLLPPGSTDTELIVLAAVRLGSTRLIDNLRFCPTVANTQQLDKSNKTLL